MVKAIAFLLCAFLIGGCAASPRPDLDEAGTEWPQSTKQHSNGRTKQRIELNIPDVERQVILSGEVTLEVESPDSIHVSMISLADKHGGYVLSSQDNLTTIRLPAARFYDALSEVEAWGDVLERQMFGHDVTEEYYDLEIRLRNIEATRDRYLGLLEHAKSVDEMLKLERELERLSKQIDLFRGKLNRLVHRVDYCTVTVETVTAGEHHGAVAALFQGVYKGVKWLFVGN